MNFTDIAPGVREFQKEGMRVPARVIANDAIFSAMEEGVYRQIANVAHLPGVRKHVLVMPDGHYGYGFPIGGVAAFDLAEGVISPGGVGYDINCGVRLLASDLSEGDVRPRLKDLVEKLFLNVPSGLGSKSKLRASDADLKDVAERGSAWAVEKGYGVKADLGHTEECGAIAGADYSRVGERARKRGKPQLGTLGSGNHFLEVSRVEKIFDEKTAKAFGLTHTGQVTAMVHCGSRGFGYQIADDYIGVMVQAARRYGITLPDKELACAPIDSREARDYVAAMYCAVNYAFANRQVITHWVRESFDSLFSGAELDLVYDVAHNIAKFEDHHEVGEVCVHRKGATRAFAAGRKELPADYRGVGQPVIVPGDMGTASYVLVGTERAMEESFGSVCHGAGRLMSRSGAKRKFRGEDVQRQLEAAGEVIRSDNVATLAEEVPDAYKNVDDVIASVELAGLCKPVAKLVPMGVAKG